MSGLFASFFWIGRVFAPEGDWILGLGPWGGWGGWDCACWWCGGWGAPAVGNDVSIAVTSGVVSKVGLGDG